MIIKYHQSKKTAVYLEMPKINTVVMRAFKSVTIKQTENISINLIPTNFINPSY